MKLGGLKEIPTLLKTQFQVPCQAQHLLVGQQGVWGGMEPGALCCKWEGGGGAEVYPPAPDIQHYKTLVAKLSQQHFIVAEALPAGKIMIFIAYPQYTSPQNVSTSHH